MQLGFEDFRGDMARVEATLPPAAANGHPMSRLDDLLPWNQTAVAA